MDPLDFSSRRRPAGLRVDPEAPITELLRAWRGGDAAAGEALVGELYGELRDLARRYLASEPPSHTLEPTALVHEAYLRLARADVAWNDRLHFFAVAALTLRRVLVDHAKGRRRAKRGGGLRVSLGDVDPAAPPAAGEEVLALDAALERLAAESPRLARAVELHYFGGLDYDEMAALLGLSRRTVARDLRLARAWLTRELGAAPESGEPT